MWLQTKSMALPRCTHAMARLAGQDCLLVCGGFNGQLLADAERYSIAEDAWTRAQPMLHERFMHCLVDAALDPSLADN